MSKFRLVAEVKKISNPALKGELFEYVLNCGHKVTADLREKPSQAQPMHMECKECE